MGKWTNIIYENSHNGSKGRFKVSSKFLFSAIKVSTVSLKALSTWKSTLVSPKKLLNISYTLRDSSVGV